MLLQSPSLSLSCLLRPKFPPQSPFAFPQLTFKEKKALKAIEGPTYTEIAKPPYITAMNTFPRLTDHSRGAENLFLIHLFLLNLWPVHFQPALLAVIWSTMLCCVSKLKMKLIPLSHDGSKWYVLKMMANIMMQNYE